MIVDYTLLGLQRVQMAPHLMRLTCVLHMLAGLELC